MKRGRLSLLVIGAISSVSTMTFSTPAHAKIVPLEVQATDGARTVRVSPAEAIEAINDGRAAGHYGIFTYSDRPRNLSDSSIRVDLMIYASRSEDGRVHDTMNSDARREKIVAFDYYRTESGAAARIREGYGRTIKIGRWVTLSASFVELVERALDRAPAVEWIDAPLQRLEPHPASLEAQDARFARTQALAGLVLVVVGGLALVLLRWSWRRVRADGTDNIESPEDKVRAGADATS